MESGSADTAAEVRTPGARKSGDLRRDEILDGTIRAVSRSGFAAVTLRDVAAEVGVAHGLIGHYFGSRDELLAAAFDRAVTAELATTCDTDPNPLVALVAWLAVTPREHYLVWIDAWSEAPRNPSLRASLARHHRDCEARLAAVIARGHVAGVLETDDPARAASSITGLADGLAVQCHAIGIIDADEVDRRVFEVVERLLAIEPGTLDGITTTSRRGSWLVA